MARGRLGEKLAVLLKMVGRRVRLMAAADAEAEINKFYVST